VIEKSLEQKVDEAFLSKSWLLYLDEMKSPLTRYKYQGNLARFLDFAGLEGSSLEQRAQAFSENGKKDTEWAFQNIIKFIVSSTDFSAYGTSAIAIVNMTPPSQPARISFRSRLT
jgi:hypothetical protein